MTASPAHAPSGQTSIPPESTARATPVIQSSVANEESNTMQGKQAQKEPAKKSAKKAAQKKTAKKSVKRQAEKEPAKKTANTSAKKVEAKKDSEK